MTDIFREVEEDVRRERLQKLWKQYGDVVIAAVSVLVLGVAGYKLWQYYEVKQTLKASGEYDAALQMSQGANNAQAALVFAKIARQAPSGYAETAKLAQADALLSSGKTADAIALYKTIADKDKNELGAVARVRAAWAEADTASRGDLVTLLQPLADPASPWRFMVREILAYSDFRDGRTAQAESEYQSLSREAGAPANLRQRAGAIAALMRSADFGTVPPPSPAAKGAANP